jgi:hypothetical protein
MLQASNIVLVFPDEIPQDLEKFKSDRFRMLLEPAKPILPETTHMFAPIVIWIDKSVRVTRSDILTEADGLPSAIRVQR